MIETQLYSDGTSATGTAPLPDVSPGQQDQSQTTVWRHRVPCPSLFRAEAEAYLRSHGLKSERDYLLVKNPIRNQNDIIRFSDAVHVTMFLLSLPS